MRQYVVLLLIVALGNAYDYVINGDFEQDLSVGWQEVSTDASVVFTRDTLYDSDPDYEACLQQGTGGGYGCLYQVCNFVTTNMEFSLNAKLLATTNNAAAWTAAAVIISYQNELGTLLGDTRIYQPGMGCPWTDSSTRHLIAAPDTNWNNYTLNIEDELAYLPGVNPLEISKIQVALFDTAAQC
jgi:hypothetical protein